MMFAENEEATPDEVQGVAAAKHRFTKHHDAIERLAQHVGRRLEVEANVADHVGDKKTEIPG